MSYWKRTVFFTRRAEELSDKYDMKKGRARVIVLEPCFRGHKEMERRGRSKDTEPVVIIPKENIQIHSRSMIIRLDSTGIPKDHRDDDFEKAKEYLHRMSHNDKFHDKY